MPRLGPRSRLIRAPDISVTIASSGALNVFVRGASHYVSEHGLAVLDEFKEPRTLAEALQTLEARTRGAADWIALTTAIGHLHDAGALVQPETEAAHVECGSGFDSPSIHIQMLDDEVRTSSYLAAIRAVVRPGDTVVDVGTGTGILAMGAASAGASKVYAIESSAASVMATALFTVNGLADRIELLRGWSTHVELPRRADVLVSEIIGNEPLEERVLEYVLDARRRLLVDDARMVPARIRIDAHPVEAPADLERRHRFTSETTARWSAAYGFDFSPLASMPEPGLRRAMVDAHRFQSRELGPPVPLVTIDLARFDAPRVEEHGLLDITTSGVLSGVVLYFELDLGGGQSLSTSPARVTPTSHWKLPVWLLTTPRPVSAGERLPVTYRYETGQAWLDLE